MWPADAPPAETYERLLQLAKDDPRVLGFFLGGSRAMGRATQWSDYDCFFVIAEDAYEAFKAELGLVGRHDIDWRPGIDLIAITLPMLEGMAAWDSDDRSFRYMFAHLTALVDKTGQVQPLIDAKPWVPEQAAHAFTAASIDHALNQLYRAAKCLRDGDADASRLEAAEAVTPFLNALFALHGRRLRPYYKYLRWELTEHPLERAPFAPDELIGLLTALGSPGGVLALQRLMAETAPMFRSAGHEATYDGWGEALDWMLTWRGA
jgi:predicted nucleotidyltransferase